VLPSVAVLASNLLPGRRQELLSEDEIERMGQAYFEFSGKQYDPPKRVENGNIHRFMNSAVRNLLHSGVEAQTDSKHAGISRHGTCVW
jgi:hypothetical protein